jgi:FAD/FMN-containing dehydrogenase
MQANATLDAFAMRSARPATPAHRCLRGGGSKDFYGQALAGTVLDTRAYRGIVEYDPAELVITARCGTPLAEIEDALAEQRQMLAFEPLSRCAARPARPRWAARWRPGCRPRRQSVARCAISCWARN